MTLPCFCLAVALLCGSTNALSIFPTSAIKRTNGLVAVACVSHTPQLEDCEFRIRYHDPNQPTKLEVPVLEFKPSEGFVTKRVIEARSGRMFFDVKGRGLPDKPNACTIVLKNVQDGRYLIGCRAKNEVGGPVEKYMALRVDGTSYEMKSATKDSNMIQTVAFGYENAVIVFDMEGLGRFTGPCELQGPQKVVQTGPSRLNAEGTVCTLPIRADDTARGVAWASAPFSGKNWNGTKLLMKIVRVTGKPKSVNLTLSPVSPTENDTFPYQEGSTLTATCTAFEAEHGAEIAWTFENEPLALEGWTVTNKSNLEDWRWPWDAKTVEQTISKTFEARDNGTLKCTVRFRNGDGDFDVTLDSKDKVLVQSDVQLCLMGNQYKRCESQVDSGDGFSLSNEACNATSFNRFLLLSCLFYFLYVSVKK